MSLFNGIRELAADSFRMVTGILKPLRASEFNELANRIGLTVDGVEKSLLPEWQETLLDYAGYKTKLPNNFLLFQDAGHSVLATYHSEMLEKARDKMADGASRLDAQKAVIADTRRYLEQRARLDKAFHPA